MFRTIRWLDITKYYIIIPSTASSGIYMACILYHEDKILVTNEDFVPVIEIDETYPSCLITDYHWLMKVACTWDDVKSLRTDMEKNATSAVHFRTKLLAAACQMQSALCVQDLGQLYHRPLRDNHGTVVLSCVNQVKVSFVRFSDLYMCKQNGEYNNNRIDSPDPEKRVRAQLTLDAPQQSAEETHRTVR